MLPRSDLKQNLFSSKYSNSSFELDFIAGLARDLYSTVHPKKATAKVSESIRSALDAELCAVTAELDHVGLICSVFDAKGEKTSDRFYKERFREWLKILPSKVPFGTEDTGKFFFKEKSHKFEYIAPLYIHNGIRGAVVVGFNDKESCSEASKRLIDTATQMTSMNINLSAHYESALSYSINEAKQEHQKFTEAILDALPVSLYVIDKNFNIVMWNRHREKGIQGLPRDFVIGRNVFEIFKRYPKEKLKREFERAFETGKIERIEQPILDENGETKHWVVSKIPMRAENGEITHVITIGEDVTERVNTIYNTSRAEKLAAVGRLAAGVVHEINNPLATISACSEALEARVKEGVFGESSDVEDLAEYLGLIRNETFRCKSITSGLLEFSRGKTEAHYRVEIGEIIESSVTLIRHQKRGNAIEIKVEIEENLPLIKADEGQLQQAIIALATNAIDAMPNGGNLLIRSFQERKNLVIEVQDTGIGIKAENMSKIFEPFFTTKELGKGTGLGLAVCYGIVTDHEGRLSVRSKVGEGTTFTIYLPIGN